MKIRVKSLAEVLASEHNALHVNELYNETNWPFDGTEVIEAQVYDSVLWAPGYHSNKYGIFMEKEVEVVSG